MTIAQSDGKIKKNRKELSRSIEKQTQYLKENHLEMRALLLSQLASIIILLRCCLASRIIKKPTRKHVLKRII